MAKQVTVEIEVNSSQVDQTIQKLGELKDLGKGLKIQYDIDGKPIDIVIDKTFNLQKQVKVLTAELRRTKEGTAEFQLLSSKLGEAQDGLAKTTAKSKDLFTSLSMLPGPIGQFFSQLQGGIELLKTFSSFTFKDLKFQFKETADDIADIGKNLKGIDNKEIDNVTNSTNGLNQTIKNTAASSAGLTGALKSTQDEWVNYDKSVGNLYKSTGALITQYPRMVNGVEQMTDAIRMSNGSIRTLSQSELIAINSGKALTLTTEGLVVAEKAATFWTTTLGATIKGVLIASGIGIAIVVIGELISLLYKMATGEEAAAKATEKLTKELESQNQVLDLNAKSASRRNAETIAQMKAQGKSESEIRKVTLQNSYSEYQRAYQAEVEAKKLYNDNVGKVDMEGFKALVKDLDEKEQATKDAYSSYKVLGYNQKADELKEQQSKNKELQQKNNEHLKKIADDNKTANQIELTNQREINSLKLTEDRDRQRNELQNQKVAEEDKIKDLELTTTREKELINQISEKYGLKLKDLNKKFKDEDIKANEDFNRKLGEISITAIKNETDRQLAARQEKYSNDLRELEKDKEFIKMSEETKAFYRNELKTALDNDVVKINNDARIKELDEELKFLQIRNEGITKGTIAFYDSQLDLLNKSKQRELAALDLSEAQKQDIEKKYAKLSSDLQKEKLNAYLGYVSAGLSAVSGFYSQQQTINGLAMNNELAMVKDNAVEQDKIKEKYFYKNRDAQVGQAVISTLQSAISAYSSLAVIPVVGPVLGAIAAAAALAFGYKQVSLIKAQQYQSSASSAASTPAAGTNANYGKNYGDGGMINGPRHAGGGVMINAEGGEAVMTRGAVTMFQPMLSMMNQMGGGTSFNIGASGQAGYDNPTTSSSTVAQPQIIKTYVVSSDLTTEQQKQARLKDLSTL
jgi:hypothetical protein